jgi:hypothetical protein
MQALISLLFCLLLGIMVKVQGIVALLWLPLGFAMGLVFAAQIALPLMLGFPCAIRLVSRGEMRSAVYNRLILTSVLWFVSLLVALFLTGFLWPTAAKWVAANAALHAGLWLGILAILVSPLSKKSQAQFRADFDRTYAQFFTGK